MRYFLFSFTVIHFFFLYSLVFIISFSCILTTAVALRSSQHPILTILVVCENKTVFIFLFRGWSYPIFTEFTSTSSPYRQRSPASLSLRTVNYHLAAVSSPYLVPMVVMPSIGKKICFLPWKQKYGTFFVVNYFGMRHPILTFCFHRVYLSCTEMTIYEGVRHNSIATSYNLGSSFFYYDEVSSQNQEKQITIKL